MECSLCASKNVAIIYEGRIRNGGLGQYTDTDVKMYQCKDCSVIWHEDAIVDLGQYYESKEYRQFLEGSSEEVDFYRKHDGETLEKFRYTGTEMFRGKIVADVGCGCGAFLDFLKGVAQSVVAIEPSEAYRTVMDRKGFSTYPYLGEAIKDFGSKVEVVTSFDVIEHVADPEKFVNDIYEILVNGGQAVIGTPTETPVMRRLLGEIYEKKLLFSMQHLWIFSEKNLERMALKAGFEKICFKYYQRYGIGNLLGWLRDKEPRSDIEEAFLTPTLDAAWKSECSKNKMADYLVMYLVK
jgi:2-polyprenyl-6-hydroxyphenyl methylase/3-demethylubiquinone-9 3-methyltransferase